LDESLFGTSADYVHNNLWFNGQRYKRASTALINGGFFKALEYYLKEIFDGPYADNI
jgi:hypothetical protein